MEQEQAHLKTALNLNYTWRQCKSFQHIEKHLEQTTSHVENLQKRKEMKTKRSYESNRVQKERNIYKHINV